MPFPPEFLKAATHEPSDIEWPFKPPHPHLLYILTNVWVPTSNTGQNMLFSSFLHGKRKKGKRKYEK